MRRDQAGRLRRRFHRHGGSRSGGRIFRLLRELKEEERPDCTDKIGEEHGKVPEIIRQGRSGQNRDQADGIEMQIVPPELQIKQLDDQEHQEKVETCRKEFSGNPKAIDPESEKPRHHQNIPTRGGQCQLCCDEIDPLTFHSP